MLCALGRDANNQMYPLAWAVVEKENYDSWFWFLALLNKDLKTANQGGGYVIISDQQKVIIITHFLLACLIIFTSMSYILEQSCYLFLACYLAIYTFYCLLLPRGLINTIEDIIPNAEHRMCARHIYSNWKKMHPNHDLQKLFWRCAKSPNKVLFKYNRAKLATFKVDGAADMMRIDPQHWSRAFIKVGNNCDSVDNNMCECFNNYIIESRYLPVVSMLEWSRRKIMVRIQQNRSKPV
jgi:hypothetical protein